MLVPALLRPRHLPWPIKVVVAVLAAVATSYLGLTASDVAPHNKAGEAAAVVFLAAATLIGSVANAVLGKLLDTASDKAEAIRETLIVTMFSASDLTGVDVRGLNAVFLVRRWSVFGEFLDPTVRAELGAHEPSSVRWTMGKGVVGRCWEQEQAQFQDLRWLPDEPTDGPEQWAAVAPDDQMGLSYSDWIRTRGKYGTIVAACTFGPSGITGVVALNARADVDWTQFEANLKTLMIATAKGVAQALK